MRTVFAILIILVLSLIQRNASIAGSGNGERMAPNYRAAADKMHKNYSAAKAQKFIDSLRDWLHDNDYSTSLLFVADMGLHMNIQRFYVVNPDSQKLLKSFLVAHGSGGGSTVNRPVFSNTPGSLCTSLGRYKIGEKYNGNFGESYRLHGLDRTNNKAFERAIVFHSYKDQTEEEYGSPNYFSSGCPMIAKRSFAYCDSLIQLEEKPVIMVIYE